MRVKVGERKRENRRVRRGRERNGGWGKDDRERDGR